MAFVSSSALRKVFVKRGKRKRGKDFAFFVKPPRWAPFRVWALKILSASSKSIGMNLNESETIRENSLIGNPIFLRGFKNHSIALIIPLCGVVSVKREAESIIIVSLRISKADNLTPLRVIPKGPILKKDSPGVKKRLRKAVREKSDIKGKRDLRIEDAGRRALQRLKSIMQNSIMFISMVFIK